MKFYQAYTSLLLWIVSAGNIKMLKDFATSSSKIFHWAYQDAYYSNYGVNEVKDEHSQRKWEKIEYILLQEHMN